MDRSQGVTVAVASLLIGIGAVLVGLLSPTASIAIAAVCFATGVYLLVGGVYLGKWTPTTYLDRAFRPHLVEVEAWVARVHHNAVIFRIKLRNAGRDDLNGAYVIVIVPEFITEMARTNAEGEGGHPELLGGFWREDERFWNGNVSFPGRLHKLMHFRVEMSPVRDFSAELRISAPALDTPLEVPLNLTLPGGESASAQAPEIGGRAL